MLAKLEGILFLSGDEGISIKELSVILETTEEKLNEEIQNLQKDCENENRGIKPQIFGDIVKFITKKEHEKTYEKLVESDISKPLTQTTLEVLAIIAYNQPITRSEIDEVRGVSSAHIIRQLVLRELISDAGRTEAPGRPIIYQTTSKFLDALGIQTLNQLPPLENIDSKDEIELFSQKINEKEEELWYNSLMQEWRNGRREGLKHLW